MAKAVQNNANVKQANPNNKVISKLKIASVSRKRTFESSFHNDEAGNPLVRIGHFYGLRKEVNGVEFGMGEKFISDKQMAEKIQNLGHEFKADVDPQNLNGSVIELEGLIEVAAGEEFLPYDSETAEIAERDMILFNNITVNKGISPAEIQNEIKAGFRDAISKKLEGLSVEELMKVSF